MHNIHLLQRDHDCEVTSSLNWKTIPRNTQEKTVAIPGTCMTFKYYIIGIMQSFRFMQTPNRHSHSQIHSPPLIGLLLGFVKTSTRLRLLLSSSSSRLLILERRLTGGFNVILSLSRGYHLLLCRRAPIAGHRCFRDFGWRGYR
jgi:hypothetical protein